MRRTAPIVVAALLLAACSSPRLDDAQLVSVNQATPEDLARVAQAWQNHPYLKPSAEEANADWPILRIVFRSSRDLIEDEAMSKTIAVLCGVTYDSGYIGANELIWHGQFLTDKNGAKLRNALRQSANEEFEFFIAYRYRENRYIPSDARTVTILPPPTDVCLRRSGAYYEASAGLPLRINRAKIIDALKPLPRTLDVHR